MATAVLSITAKAKARAKKQEKEKQDDMEVDVVSPTQTVQEIPEPLFEKKKNMSRMVPFQIKHCAFNPEARYVPLLKVNDVGIMMLIDQHPSSPPLLLERKIPLNETNEKVESPPEPFEYVEPNE